MAWIPKFEARSPSSSTFTFRIFSCPFVSSASPSRTGVNARHDAHQGAQKSSKTGPSEPSTSVAKSLLLRDCSSDMLAPFSVNWGQGGRVATTARHCQRMLRRLAPPLPFS